MDTVWHLLLVPFVSTGSIRSGWVWGGDKAAAGDRRPLSLLFLVAASLSLPPVLAPLALNQKTLQTTSSLFFPVALARSWPIQEGKGRQEGRIRPLCL